MNAYKLNVVFPTYDDKDSLPLLHAVADMPTGHDENDVGGDHASDRDDDDCNDENPDPHWQLTDKEKFNDDEITSSEDEFDRSSTQIPDSEKKFLVFNSKLNDLLQRCQRCGAVIIGKKEKNNW